MWYFMRYILESIPGLYPNRSHIPNYNPYKCDRCGYETYVEELYKKHRDNKHK